MNKKWKEQVSMKYKMQNKWNINSNCFKIDSNLVTKYKYPIGLPPLSGCKFCHPQQLSVCDIGQVQNVSHGLWFPSSHPSMPPI